LGADMEHLMSTGAPMSRRASASASAAASSGTAVRPPVDAILSHPPRPRKKSRR
jgi:hypothetical protein